MRFNLDGVEFSGESGEYGLRVREFVPGGVDLRTQDEERAQQDGILVGKDLLGGRLWTWDISARGAGLDEVMAANARLERVWRDGARLQPGLVSALTYHMSGRWRRVYGRPRRYAGPTPDYLAISGVGYIVCDFRVTDPLHYDEDESSVVLTIVPATTGGLESPLMAPLSTVRSSAPRAGLVTNAGDAPTPLKVTFHGPITDPWVRAAGLEVGLVGTLAYDREVTVDPLAGTITGLPAGVVVTRKTRLSGTLLQSGTTELTFGGTDSTGTATATLAWRNAHTSI